MFEEKWIEWWVKSQPEWRGVDEWPLLRDDTTVGDWGHLSSGGKDGLFLIVLSLGWWVHAQGSAVNSKVEDAIADVSWVMRHLVTLLATGDDVGDDSPSATPTSSRTKRPRPSKGGLPRKRIRG